MAAPCKTTDEYEQATWSQVQGTWQQLHGSFAGRGLSVEWHDFQTSRELAWSESFHPDSLEICLNLSGNGSLLNGGEEVAVSARSIAMYAPSEDLGAIRARKGSHQFLTVELSRNFLAEQLGATMASLRQEVRAFIDGDTPGKPLIDSARMSSVEHGAFSRWTAPGIPTAAQPLWYDAKVLELLANLMFAPTTPKAELFCDRQKRMGRERMERVVEILRVRLQDPPSLEELGREVGCSPFYLSRTFSEQAGQTIPQFIRQLRMERAAELLREGRMNVTEVAFDVGYSSLGHFSKSFCEVIGVCPSLYPAAASLSRKTAPRTGRATQR